MRKIITTLLFIVMGLVQVHAQLQFVDQQGNVIPDGSEVRFITPNAELLQYGMYQIPMEIMLKNAGMKPYRAWLNLKLLTSTRTKAFSFVVHSVTVFHLIRLGS